MRVVCGTVEWINNPLPIAAPTPTYVSFTRLLSENSMLRIVGTNLFNDQLFRGQIGFGNEIDIALVGDLRRTQAVDKNAAGFASNLNSEVKQLIPLKLVLYFLIAPYHLAEATV